MKENKNDWFYILLNTVLGIVFAWFFNREDSSIETRITFAFLSGAMFAIPIDFLLSTAYEYVLRIKNKSRRFDGELPNDDLIKIIEEKGIKDIRTLLAELGNPQLEYRTFWRTNFITRDTNEILYIEDNEYYFYDSNDNGKYENLKLFEEEYYEIELELFSCFIHFNKTENTLYYFRIDDVNCDQLFLDETVEYTTYKEITQFAYNNNLTN